MSAPPETISLGRGHPVQVIATDAMAALASQRGPGVLGAHSVQCVITSPPYLGLRDYGLDPLVWAPVEYAPMPGVPPIRVPEWGMPDRYPTCVHQWAAWSEYHNTREEVAHGKTRTGDLYYGAPSRRYNGAHHNHRHGQFCLRCGAWRGALGLEPTPALYIGHLVQVFRAVRRVLRDDGTLWLNLGDRYAVCALDGLKRKDLVGIPWRAAYALQADGWYLRSDVVWAKGTSFSSGNVGNAMPESVTDRPTRAHDFVFLLTKSERYFYDHYAVREEAVTQPQRRLTQRGSARDQVMRSDKVYPYRLMNEPGRQQARRNLRDVWRINTQPFKEAHFAVFPPNLVRPMIRAGTPQAGCCAACGTPRRRAPRREKLLGTQPGCQDPRTGGLLPAQRWDRTGLSHREVSEWLAAHPIGHHSWEPGCDCAISETVPAVVLDPFAGAGTTGLVAMQEGRHAILLEPNPEYREIIGRRIRGDDRNPDRARSGGSGYSLPPSTVPPDPA